MLALLGSFNDEEGLTGLVSHFHKTNIIYDVFIFMKNIKSNIIEGLYMIPYRILIGVSVVFFFSWAPLNIFNIVDLLVKTSEDPGTQVN